MKTATILGIVLIVLSVFSFAYGGISYKTHKKVLDLGPIEATKTKTHTTPLPPILGTLFLVGGVVLVIAGKSSS